MQSEFVAETQILLTCFVSRGFANGPDNEIYCLFCYDKIHGKKAKTKSMPLDTTSIEGDGELGTCPRCNKLF